MSAAPTQAPSATLVRVVQVLAGLSVLSVLAQFITAGQLFPEGGPEGLHAGGAIVLHVVSGLAAVVAVVLWRSGRRSLAFAALAVVVFGFTFVQAALGGRSSLWIHVPGAMVLTVGVVWFFILSLGGDRSRRTAS